MPISRYALISIGTLALAACGADAVPEADETDRAGATSSMTDAAPRSLDVVDTAADGASAPAASQTVAATTPDSAPRTSARNSDDRSSTAPEPAPRPAVPSPTSTIPSPDSHAGHDMSDMSEHEMEGMHQ